MSPTPQQCRDELDRVLASKQFHRAEQLGRLLRWLCARHLDNPGATFTQYEIAVQCLRRSPTFNPHDDSAVRREIARLRERLTAHYAAHPTSFLRISIDPGTYAPRWDPQPEPDSPTSAIRLLVLPFESIGPTPEPGIADAFSIALMAYFADQENIEVAPRYLALLHRQHPFRTDQPAFHYLLEGVVERRVDRLVCQSWLVQGQRAFLHTVSVSAPTLQDLTPAVGEPFASYLKERTVALP